MRLADYLTGAASLDDLDRFQLAGNLRNFDIDQVARTLLGKALGYDGIVSGPVQADGQSENSCGAWWRARISESRPAGAACR